MNDILDNPTFTADFERLASVKLNPTRHAATDAKEHTMLVVERTAELAAMNSCTAEETRLLQNLAYVHDIGKIEGTANPTKSIELLPRYGITDEKLTMLVKYHDTNLPWFLASERGQPPTDKAWRKLARNVDVRLLCLFMIADRIDCPGGWKANRPVTWFLEEVGSRDLLETVLNLNDGPVVEFPDASHEEVSAGVALVRTSDSGAELLVIRVRSVGYELPKGHVEVGETAEEAAIREVKEETGLTTTLPVEASLGSIEYTFERDILTVTKRVEYYLARADERTLSFGETPKRTRELRWITEDEVGALELVNEDLRPILRKALEIGD